MVSFFFFPFPFPLPALLPWLLHLKPDNDQPEYAEKSEQTYSQKTKTMAANLVLILSTSESTIESSIFDPEHYSFAKGC